MSEARCGCDYNPPRGIPILLRSSGLRLLSAPFAKPDGAARPTRESHWGGRWPSSPDLIALRSSAFGQIGVRDPSGWSAIGCDSVEYYCDAYASEPTVDQSFIVI